MIYLHFDVLPDVGISNSRCEKINNHSCFNRSSQHTTRNFAPCLFVDYAGYVTNLNSREPSQSEYGLFIFYQDVATDVFSLEVYEKLNAILASQSLQSEKEMNRAMEWSFLRRESILLIVACFLTWLFH